MLGDAIHSGRQYRYRQLACSRILRDGRRPVWAQEGAAWCINEFLSNGLRWIRHSAPSIADGVKNPPWSVSK